MTLGLIVAFAVFFSDQLSKWFVQGYFDNIHSPQAFGSFFNLVEAWNTGVSFSMFNDGGILGMVVLSLFAIGVIVFLLMWLKKEDDKVVQLSLGFIIGGALGNVVDRIRFGAVYDFLDFYYNNWHWPAFNLADAFICTGAFIIILHGMIKAKSNIKKEGEK
ncbi:MAG: signal peptidase II [Alphaproteobacteria bacterium]|nr:signal peptidase II [Alphaproteobacteria bacterium]